MEREVEGDGEGGEGRWRGEHIVRGRGMEGWREECALKYYHR